MGAPEAALPFVNWLFWAMLGGGTLLVVAVTEVLGGTTRGYRLFMAWFVAVAAAVLLLSGFALPADTGAGLYVRLSVAFGCLAAAYLVASMLNVARSALGVLGALAGTAAAAALALGAPSGAPGLFAAHAVAGTLALGSVTAAMLLGHWYLVTPSLSPRPLQRMIWLLIVSLAGQAALFGIAAVLVPGTALAGSIGWLTWLRLAAGTLLPIGIAVLAILASRAASLQASTGLLYIGLALIAAGTIAGSSITFITGVPV